jgi:S-methylmethionine-dependent homocysteine/selenocysteine methylase
LKEAATIAREEGTDAVLLSGAPLSIITNNLSAVLDGTPAGAQATVGRYSPPSWKPDFYPRFEDTDLTSPEQYAEVACKWFASGAKIVGGSSGTTSEHIAAIREQMG